MNAVRKVLIALFIGIFIGGVFYALYPFFMGRWLEYQYASEAENFLCHTIPAAIAPKNHPDDPASGTILVPMEHQDLWDAMQEYNERIFAENQIGLGDAWSYQTPSFDLAAYGIEDGIIGVIYVPALDVELPIYLGANSANMAKGAVHLSQTSLPIGGENTNSVIAAHRGWYNAAYFRYIEKLNVGDQITITNLWETLIYQVTEIKIIDPNDVDEILIQPGKDMVTLLTCHPYASGGRQRYVVYCERIGAPA